MSYNYIAKGSNSDPDPELMVRLEEYRVHGKKSPREKWTQLLVIILFIAVVTLACLLAVAYSMGKEDNANEVCTTRDCVVTASSLAAKMDPSADPCQDFARFACGGFYRDTIIPDDRNKVTSFTLVNDKNARVLRIIMEGEIQDHDESYLKKMKMYYQNCMDEDAIESVGLTPYTSSEFAKDWPTINPAWLPATFDLNAVIEKYEREFVEPVFVYVVSTDFEDSNKHKLHIAQARLGLSLKHMKLPRNDSTLVAYQRYYEDIAIELGADSVIARQDAEDVINFEMELAKIMVTKEESIDLNTVNNPSTLKNMSRDYPFIDFHRAVQAAFDAINKPISEDLLINVRHPKYFAKLKEVLDATDNRVIMNLFGFKYARMNVGMLTKRMREIRMKFAQAVTGKKKENPRWRQCLSGTIFFIGDAVGKAFVMETFTQDSKLYMDTMIFNLKTIFAELLQENEWMEPKTKEAALLKLSHMRRKIGFPDENFSVEFIDAKYENYTIFLGKYYKTYTEAFRQRNIEGLQKLGEKVDKEKWMMLPSEVNAYYSSTMNEIGFPAGILQPPYFSEQAPSSVNYGAIGSIIGHEITHGFDQSGSQMDHKGNLKNWWQSKDLQEFKKRTKCVVDQYGDFELDEISLKLNGKLTAGENTADIGGLKESFRAYKAHANKQSKELPLPGLNLSPDQQFFLAYAQLWCSKKTDAELRNDVLTGVHSPGRFRIKGALQNNEDFSRVFECPAGSPMNPVKKCVVW